VVPAQGTAWALIRRGGKREDGEQKNCGQLSGQSTISDELARP
jgi:hypothetical protein